MVSALHEKVFHSLDLGTVGYEAALEIQRNLVLARKSGDITDVLILLEHHPVITTGRFHGNENIKMPPDIIEQKGIQLVSTNRGGSATFHGPGQLVAYPIINLRNHHLGVREYIWKLEEVIIRLLDGLGITAYRMDSYPGSVWAKDKKICSFGINVSQYITMHGLALNVCNDLSYFDFINPCGLDSDMMTSILKIIGDSISVNRIKAALIEEFTQVFSAEYHGETKIDALS